MALGVMQHRPRLNFGPDGEPACNMQARYVGLGELYKSAGPNPQSIPGLQACSPNLGRNRNHPQREPRNDACILILKLP